MANDSEQYYAPRLAKTRETTKGFLKGVFGKGMLWAAVTGAAIGILSFLGFGAIADAVGMTGLGGTILTTVASAATIFTATPVILASGAIGATKGALEGPVKGYRKGRAMQEEAAEINSGIQTGTATLDALNQQLDQTKMAFAQAQMQPRYVAPVFATANGEVPNYQVSDMNHMGMAAAMSAQKGLNHG